MTKCQYYTGCVEQATKLVLEINTKALLVYPSGKDFSVVCDVHTEDIKSWGEYKIAVFKLPEEIEIIDNSECQQCNDSYYSHYTHNKHRFNPTIFDAWDELS